MGGKIYCYANFFCYANFSIVLGPNFRGPKVSEGGKLPQGAPPPPPPWTKARNIGVCVLLSSLECLTVREVHEIF